MSPRPLGPEPVHARAVLAQLVRAGDGVALAAGVFVGAEQRAVTWLLLRGWAERSRARHVAGVGQLSIRATAAGRAEHARSAEALLSLPADGSPPRGITADDIEAHEAQLRARLYDPDAAALEAWRESNRATLDAQVNHVALMKLALEQQRQRNGSGIQAAASRGARAASSRLCVGCGANVTQKQAHSEGCAEARKPESERETRSTAGDCPRCGAQVFDGLRLLACSACGWKREPQQAVRK